MLRYEGALRWICISVVCYGVQTETKTKTNTKTKTSPTLEVGILQLVLSEYRR